MRKRGTEKPAAMISWGEEQAAEPCYRRCYETGWDNLPETEQKFFFIGYGSTLRNNLKYDEAIAVFPEDPALQMFLALAHYSNQENKEAAEILFRTCLSTTEEKLGGFEKPLRWYVENLHDYPKRGAAKT